MPVKDNEIRIRNNNDRYSKGEPMSIDIKHEMVKVPTEIIVDDITYPIHQFNIEAVIKYWDTGNEEELKNLKNFSLSFE